VRGVVYVLAKEPEPGRVKTRLCPPLTPQQAAELAEALLTDTVARLCAGAAWEVVLAVDPAGGGPILDALCVRFRLARVEQGQGDLGNRMGGLMARGHGSGRPVLLVGADTPDLPIAYVAMAVDCLSREPVVLGPSRDGGYYLVGAGSPVPGLFDIDAAWSSAGVLAATVRRLEEQSIRPFLLPAWEDIDDAGALLRLSLRLRDGLAEAESTAELLERWASRGVTF